MNIFHFLYQFKYSLTIFLFIIAVIISIIFFLLEETKKANKSKIKDGYIDDKVLDNENKVIKEGLKPISLQQVKNALDPKKNGIAEKAKKAFDPLTEVLDRIRDMGKFFDSIPGRFRNINHGLKDIFEGLFVTEFKGIAKGIGRGFKDIFDINEGGLIHDSLYFLGMYGSCGIKYITNFKQCSVYYLVDMLFSIVYSPIKLILFLFYLIGLNLYPVEKWIWEKVYWVDNKLYDNYGFNVLKWPRSVRDTCYECKRLKPSVIKRRANEVHLDFTTRIRDDMSEGIDQMNRGAAEFRSAFT